MDDTCLPSALFASCCSSFCPKELVKQILAVEQLPDTKSVIENIEAFDWHIETKYYTSDIQLCTTTGRTIGDEKFADSVQAFVVYFNPESNDSFELTKAWLSYLKLISPAVQLLVCDKCNPNSTVGRLTIQNWCIDNEFELVELSPEEDGSDSEDDFGETTGIKRIIQALHSHTWPNLKLKENPSICSPYMRQLMKEQAEANAEQLKTDSENVKSKHSEESELSQNVNSSCDRLSGKSEDRSDNKCKDKSDNKSDDRLDDKSDNKSDDKSVQNSPNSSDSKNQFSNSKDTDCCSKNLTTSESSDQKKTTERDKKDTKKPAKKPNAAEMIDSLLPMDDAAMFEALGTDDPGGESFEQLFEKFRIMKEKAETLPPEARKAYAEKVAVSFWKAIGGDEDEVEGITDSDDDI